MIKQVIVIRKDLNMRKGKMIAQGAHASMAVILNAMKVSYKHNLFNDTVRTIRELITNETEPMDKWLDGPFTKICLYVESEEDLLFVYNKAKESNLPTALIIDSGKTEFNGVATKTCIAIGPAKSEDIDKITSSLRLL